MGRGRRAGGEAMTHADLVTRAVRWLRNTQRCGVVFAEHSAGWEHPDAMGWRGGGYSTVVECKVSRADFFKDRKKPSRAAYNLRPALWCYYLTPSGLVSPNELPEGWGLLYADERITRVIRKADPAFCDRTVAQLKLEVDRLYCEVRRYQVNGITYPKLTGR
jgi:hypothetical protein